VNSWKVILATLVIFGAGVVTGGLLVNYAIRSNGGINPATGIAAANQQQRPAQMPALTPWQLRNRDLVHKMDRALDLTPEQRDHITKIIADSQDRTKALWKPIAPQMNRELQRVHAQIRDELTPDQQKKFDEIMRPHGPKRGDDSFPPNHPGGQRRTTNFPSLESPGVNPTPGPGPAPQP
jgi:hypothetical protein